MSKNISEKQQHFAKVAQSGSQPMIERTISALFVMTFLEGNCAFPGQISLAQNQGPNPRQ
jgi:hypothetical protein